MELFYEFEPEDEANSQFGYDVEEDFKYLANRIAEIDSSIDLNVVRKAYDFCVFHHNGVFRKSGKPYYTHPLSVALILLQEFTIHDTASIAACLLHDTVEDVFGVTRELIAEEFSEEIAEMVDGVTKIAHSQISNDEKPDDFTKSINSDGSRDAEKDFIEPKFSYELTKAEKSIIKAKTYRKLFLALVKDVRVILIKFADRLHNLRTIHYHPNVKKQAEIGRETLNFYVPLAHRLGLRKVKAEFENRSFYSSDKEAYEAIRTSLNEKRRDFLDYIMVFYELIRNSLNSQNIDHLLSIVHKHEYEIFQMMQDGKSISEIDNFYSMVVILDSNEVSDCYRAHGALANVFKTISFYDNITNPRLDWFKSLHSELYGTDGKRIEILIRTNEMEKIAEEGFASQFSLKSGALRALDFTDDEIDAWGEWMQEMIEMKGEKATKLIWDSIKTNLFDSDITAFDKVGNKFKLPNGATLLDFAFALSENSGLHFVSGKINNVFKDLNEKIKDGDRIDIITSPNVRPKLYWKNEVITHRAVVGLHKYFKLNEPEEYQAGLQDKKFVARLMIKGENRTGMLANISNTVGTSNIQRINLDTADSVFEGAIAVYVEDLNHLNRIIASLVAIRGVKGIHRVETN